MRIEGGGGHGKHMETAGLMQGNINSKIDIQERRITYHGVKSKPVMVAFTFHVTCLILVAQMCLYIYQYIHIYLHIHT